MSAGRNDLTFIYLAPFIRAAKGVLSEDDFEAIKPICGTARRDGQSCRGRVDSRR
jgi:hypothetical protein